MNRIRNKDKEKKRSKESNTVKLEYFSYTIHPFPSFAELYFHREKVGYGWKIVRSQPPFLTSTDRISMELFLFGIF